MRLRKFIVPLGIAVLFVLAWQSMRWPGVLAVGGGVVMWLLLHITQVMRVMQRAAQQPVGTVASAHAAISWVVLTEPAELGLAPIHLAVRLTSWQARQAWQHCLRCTATMAWLSPDQVSSRPR